MAGRRTDPALFRFRPVDGEGRLSVSEWRCVPSGSSRGTPEAAGASYRLRRSRMERHSGRDTLTRSRVMGTVVGQLVVQAVPLRV